MFVVSLFSICLKCFFFIFLIFDVFVMTCTISDFFLFSSWRFRFSLRLCFFNSFSSCLAAIIALDASFTLCSSSRSACFFSNELLIPFVLIIDENLVFSDFQMRPDFGLPLGIIFTGFLGLFLQKKRLGNGKA